MITNPLSNQNYINKDFQVIYPELLDAVKKLTEKWDPTISNESDPGVILLKLNAIIADKNNYNIDKNILECFPDSVSQYGNAYKLFSQLGYNMHWYRSGTGKGLIQYKVKETDNYGDVSFTVPMFTMFCDEDKENIFTSISDTALALNGDTATMDIMQGVVKDLKIGSSNKISFANLDNNLRIYFPVFNVAENGIFISNALEEDGKYSFDMSSRWEQVDNLHIQALNTKVYEFGVDQTNNTCYVEFPLDASNLMKDGIVIKYIQSDGASGNIFANKLSTLYSDTTIEGGGQEIVLKGSDIKYKNISSISNGRDPETIDDAYVNYKRTVGTFDTLVTLRDYLNFILEDSRELVSNGFITDRTCDFQDSYSIVTFEDSTTKIKNENKKVISSEGSESLKDGMQPFELKAYFFNYSRFPAADVNVSTLQSMQAYRQSYDDSFKFDGLTIKDSVEEAYKNSKSIQHNFTDIEENRQILIKNLFDLNITIIPTTLITQRESEDLKKNLYNSLLKAFQSKNIEFGKEITYEEVYDVCNNADARIKAVALDNFEYTPYALFYNGAETKFEEIQLSTSSLPLTDDNTTNISLGEKISLEILAKNILAGKTPMYIQNSDFSYQLNQSGARSISASKIDTKCQFEFRPNNPEHEVLPNESICLYAPGLNDVISYSAGVKFFFYSRNSKSDSIPANTDYRLSGGEQLTFFWTDEDGADALYLYKTYTAGDIINATFQIEQDVDLENFSEIGNVLFRVYQGEGRIVGDFNNTIRELNGSKHVLSTARTINIREIQSVSLKNKNNLCYWITNQKNDNGDKYILTLNAKNGIKEFAKIPAYTYPSEYNQGQYVAISNYERDSISIKDSNATDIFEEIKTSLDIYNKNTNRVVGQTFSSYLNRFVINATNLATVVNDAKVVSNASAIDFDNNNSLTITSEVSRDGYVYFPNMDKPSINDEEGNAISIPSKNIQRISNDALSYYKKNLKLANNSTNRKVYIDLDHQLLSIEDDGVGYITVGNGDTETGKFDKVYTENSTLIGEAKGRSLLFTYETVDGNTGWTINRNSDNIYTSEQLKTTFGIGFINNDYSDINSFTIELLNTPEFGVRYNIGTVYTVGEDIQINVSTNFSEISKMVEGEYRKFYYGKGIKIDKENSAAYYEVLQDPIQNIIQNFVMNFGLDIILGQGKYIAIGTMENTADTSMLTYEYTLRNNEWFIYTDEYFSSFEMLGAGGTVKIQKYKDPNATNVDTSINFEVPIVNDVENILKDGEQALSRDAWHIFNFNDSAYQSKDSDFGDLVTCIINQQIFLGEGSKIKVEFPEGDYEYLVITSDGCSSKGTLPLVTEQVLYNYQISYLGPDSTQWEYLPRNKDYDLLWDAYSILNINIPQYGEQRLYREHKNQFVVYEDINSAEPSLIPVYPDTPASDTSAKDTFVQCDVPITMEGGKGIDVRYVDLTNIESNSLIPINLFAYTKNIFESDSQNSYSITNNEDLISITIKAQLNDPKETTVPLKYNISFNGGKIILPIEFSRELKDAETLSIINSNVVEPTPSEESTANDSAAQAIFINNNIDIIKPTVRYYMVLAVSSDANDMMLSFNLENINSDFSIKLYPLFTCKYAFDGEQQNTKDKLKVDEGLLLSEIAKFDVEHQFDYTFVPSEGYLLNPLYGKNYFDKNNFANPFTIPKIKKLDVKVVNIK